MHRAHRQAEGTTEGDDVHDLPGCRINRHSVPHRDEDQREPVLGCRGHLRGHEAHPTDGAVGKDGARHHHLRSHGVTADGGNRAQGQGRTTRGAINGPSDVISQREGGGVCARVEGCKRGRARRGGQPLRAGALGRDVAEVDFKRGLSGGLGENHRRLDARADLPELTGCSPEHRECDRRPGNLPPGSGLLRLPAAGRHKHGCTDGNRPRRDEEPPAGGWGVATHGPHSSGGLRCVRVGRRWSDFGLHTAFFPVWVRGGEERGPYPAPERKVAACPARASPCIPAPLRQEVLEKTAPLRLALAGHASPRLTLVRFAWERPALLRLALERTAPPAHRP